MKNKNYLFFMAGTSIVAGSFIGGLLVSISFLLKPFGFKENDISLILGVVPLAGGFGVYIG